MALDLIMLSSVAVFAALRVYAMRGRSGWLSALTLVSGLINPAIFIVRIYSIVEGSAGLWSMQLHNCWKQPDIRKLGDCGTGCLIGVGWFRSLFNLCDDAASSETFRTSRSSRWTRRHHNNSTSRLDRTNRHIASCSH